MHLSSTYENALAAGERRAEAPIVIVVDAAKAQEAGCVIAQAGKTVYVTDHVPADFLRRAE